MLRILLNQIHSLYFPCSCYCCPLRYHSSLQMRLDPSIFVKKKLTRIETVVHRLICLIPYYSNIIASKIAGHFRDRHVFFLKKITCLLFSISETAAWIALLPWVDIIIEIEGPVKLQLQIIVMTSFFLGFVSSAAYRNLSIACYHWPEDFCGGHSGCW